jgi:hypothetical protein
MTGNKCDGPSDYQPGGWNCSPCFGEILFFDPADYEARIATTINPWEVLPYETWRPTEMWEANNTLGGAAYDDANDKLYVMETGASGAIAIIHEWTVGNPTGSSYVLDITKAGDGTGTVTSSPAGISCGLDCSHTYASATAVTLTATPAASNTFSGWSGDADCSDGSVTMNSAVSCTATFTADTEPPPDLGCAAIQPPTPSAIINVGPTDDFVGAIEGAASGTEIRLAPGTYDVSGGDAADRINMVTPGITVIGTTGNADDVVFDADYSTEELFYIQASDITLAHFTIKELGEHAIHASGPQDTIIDNLWMHNLVIQDNSAQQIKVTFTGTGYVDNGILECSEVVFTATGRANVEPVCYTGAIDVHGGLDWIVRNNLIQGFWCATGLPDPAIHFWNGSRNTQVYRNVLIDNCRGIMFGGFAASEPARVYDPDPYPGDDLHHIDGLIANNFIAWNDSGLSASANGMDSGIQCEECKRVDVYNNTLAGTFGAGVSAIEVRYAVSEADLINNLTSEGTSTDWVERDSGTITTDTTNVSNISESVYFVDTDIGDLHLTASATLALNAGTTGYVTDDIDGDVRANPPEVGADEYLGSPPTGHTLTITLNGNGDVNSSPAGIDCGSDCTEDYTTDTVVQLSPTPDEGSFFRYFSGDADCLDGQITMTAAVSCTINFADKNWPGTAVPGGVDID